MSAADYRGPWATRPAMTRGRDGKDHPDDRALEVVDRNGTLLHRGHWGAKPVAHLIAAAPELLDELERAKAALDEVFDDRHGEFRGCFEESKHFKALCDVYDAIGAVVAKARGQ